LQMFVITSICNLHLFLICNFWQVFFANIVCQLFW
jgi:hypothetical protein